MAGGNLIFSNIEEKSLVLTFDWIFLSASKHIPFTCSFSRGQNSPSRKIAVMGGQRKFETA